MPPPGAPGPRGTGNVTLLRGETEEGGAVLETKEGGGMLQNATVQRRGWDGHTGSRAGGEGTRTERETQTQTQTQTETQAQTLTHAQTQAQTQAQILDGGNGCEEEGVRERQRGGRGAKKWTSMMGVAHGPTDGAQDQGRRERQERQAKVGTEERGGESAAKACIIDFGPGGGAGVLRLTWHAWHRRTDVQPILSLCYFSQVVLLVTGLGVVLLVTGLTGCVTCHRSWGSRLGDYL
jgi:hypothetical protein